MRVKEIEIVPKDSPEEIPLDDLSKVRLEVVLDKQTIYKWRDRFIHFTEEDNIDSISLELIPHLDARPKITVKTKINYK